MDDFIVCLAFSWITCGAVGVSVQVHCDSGMIIVTAEL